MITSQQQQKQQQQHHHSQHPRLLPPRPNRNPPQKAISHILMLLRMIQRTRRIGIRIRRLIIIRRILKNNHLQRPLAPQRNPAPGPLRRHTMINDAPRRLIDIGPRRKVPKTTIGHPERDGALARLPGHGLREVVVGAVEGGHGEASARGPLFDVARGGDLQPGDIAGVLIHAAGAGVTLRVELAFVE